MDTLTLGFSSCPNDTFMFAALVNKWIKGSYSFRLTIDDVEVLNSLVLKGALDISKVSCHVLPYVGKQYCFLPVGAALGRGCGPLLVTRRRFSLSDLPKAVIAVPGRYTTAYALLRLYAPHIKETQVVFSRFDRIMPEVASGRVDFGLIIHEGRFVYPQYGLKAVLDLGEWWEKKTKLPLPLGGIIARRDLGHHLLTTFSSLLRESILFAYKHDERVLPYVKQYACHLDEQVVRNHIHLYVNQFSLALGKEGRQAIEVFLRLMKMNLGTPDFGEVFLEEHYESTGDRGSGFYWF